MCRKRSFAMLCWFVALAVPSVSFAQSQIRSGDRFFYRVFSDTSISDSTGYARNLTSSTDAVVRVEEWKADGSATLYLSLLPTTVTDKHDDATTQSQAPRTAITLALSPERKSVRVSGFAEQSLDRLAGQLLAAAPAAGQAKSQGGWQRTESMKLSDGTPMRLAASYTVNRTFELEGTRCAEVAAAVDGRGTHREGGRRLTTTARYVVAYDTGDMVAADVQSAAEVTAAGGYVLTVKQRIQMQSTAPKFQSWLRDEQNGFHRTAFTMSNGADAAAPPKLFVAGAAQMLFTGGTIATGATAAVPQPGDGPVTGAALLIPAKGSGDLAAAGAAGVGAGAAVVPVAAGAARTETVAGGGSSLPLVVGGIVLIGGGAAAAAGGGGGGGDGSDVTDSTDGSGGLSDVIVDSRDVTITLFDFGAHIDGDQVDIIVNGTTIVSNYVLKAPPGETFSLHLASGLNTLVVHADNEGWSPPNTAAVSISNVIGGIADQHWRIKTNETASMTISAP